ncbi:hypothetical protein AB0I54_47805 [Streptomyces sp. NPDC050625]|uniref:hypothetical protein n=1 Tax=Streptomyces sp. NPDC050625 TaxID=3154629 RepID=UPI003443529E
MVEHTTVIHGITRATTHRGGWVEHEPTGRAVVHCTCGLDSGTVTETQAVQIADDHRRTAAEARSAPDKRGYVFLGTATAASVAIWLRR